MWHCRRFVLVNGASTLCAAGAPLTPIGAETCAPSQDRVTLTITGAIGKTNVPGRADFDLAGLVWGSAGSRHGSFGPTAGSSSRGSGHG
jgi:hypothetical protein